MEINLILQIKNNEYVISNNNGTFIYQGSILNLKKRENLEIEEKRITEKKYNLGFLINEKTIILSNKKENNSYKDKDKSMEYNINKMQEISSELPNGFYDNCYALLPAKNKKENNILIYYCKNDQRWVIKKNEEEKSFKKDDSKFEVECFLPIQNNVKNIIEGFSEIYDENKIYLLVGGYEYYHKDRQNKIKLYIFNDFYNEIEKIKDIMIEKNDICDELSKIKKIIQIDYKNVMIIFSDGKAIQFDIMNLETNLEANEKESEKESLAYNLKKISPKNLLDLNVIDIPILKDKTINYIYPLKNRYFIIVQEFVISVFYMEDFKLIKNFKITDMIKYISQIKENQVIIYQNDGLLYELVFSDYKKFSDKVEMINKNKLKYTLILKIPNKDNEYIASLPKHGTFKVTREISSFSSSEDLKNQTVISNIEFKNGVIIQIKNQKIAILINNINNKGICLIVDIENKGNKYILIENDYLYSSLMNCITSLKTNENSNNNIILIASKRGRRNRISVINIGLPLKTTLKDYKETDIEITCMSPFKNENNTKTKSFTYCYIGGIKGNFNVEIDLYKIIFLDENKNCLCIECIEKVIYDKEKISWINSMFISFNGKQLIIASDNKLYMADISTKNKEELE